MNHHGSMNRAYRLVWSQISNAWVPVAETAKGRGKSTCARSISTRHVLAAAISIALASAAGAAPSASPRAAPICGAAVAHPLGGRLVSGSANITQVGNVTDIRQLSPNVSIDWVSFNIGSQATVDFLQPSASSVAVNRIEGDNGSEILGHLDANGQVYLINSNGIVFGPGAEVNVGGLVASTLNVSDSAPSASTRSFAGMGTGSIVNAGSIAAANGGYVALLGNRVSNQGVITAQLGTVALGAGSAVTLDFSGNRLIHLQVDKSTLNNLAANHQLIQADGGLVVMTAGAQNALLASVVNNTGVIEARTVENHEGTIELLGGMTAGTVNVAGILDAMAPDGGNGGFIETNAAHVEVADSAHVTTAASKGLTGTWLIDPADFTVAPTGGDITGATLSSDLNSTNFTILSSSGASVVSGGGSGGNINVNDTVSWNANTTLTLTAANNVNVNGNVTATGNSAGLVIQPNTTNGSQTASGSGVFNLAMANSITLSGTNPSLSIGGHAYAVINSLGMAGSTTGTDLQGINGNLSGYYALGSNIDATPTATWNSDGATPPVYAGFTPIGNSSSAFNGTFDGLGHTVSNLSINLSSANGVGLFGTTGVASVIQNVGLFGGSVRGANNVGGLVGYNYGTISRSYATGNVSGVDGVGGLVGSNFGGFVNTTVSGTLNNSYATDDVQGTEYVGGLVGYNHGIVSNSYATGSVNGATYVGGLLGFNDGNYEVRGAVSNSYATGSVKGTSYVGGLVGANAGAYGGSISNSYATGSVTGGSNVGGLVGYNSGGNAHYGNDGYGSVGSISSSHATGTVSGTSAVGGLVGLNAGKVGGSYATGTVSGTNAVGGLIGNNGVTFSGVYQSIGPNGAVSGSFATGSVTGSTNVGGLVGLNGLGSGSFVMGNYGVAGTISNSYSKGSVSGTGNNVGGLVGYSNGTVSNSYASGNVTGANDVGGLVGSNAPVNGYNNTGAISITSSFATGNVSGSGNVGGLAGSIVNSPIVDSYATGSATGTASNIGGLVGYSGSNGYSCCGGYNLISNSYATGNVVGFTNVGGLVGYKDISGTAISNSYATGNVNGSNNVGGLVGYSGYSGNGEASISNSYAVGRVIGASNVGGLVGYNAGTVSNSFWNVTTSGQTTSAGGTGLTTAQMQTSSSFTGWSISETGASGDVWRIYQGHTFPLLRNFLTPLTLTDAPDTTANYNGRAQSGPTSAIGGVWGAAAIGTNAGFYNGYYSTQQGYDITGGNLTINPASLTLSGTRVYNGTTSVAGSTLTAKGVAGQSFSVTGAGNPSNLANKNVQTGSTLATVTGLALGSSSNGGLASNYYSLSTTGSSISITPLALTVATEVANSKVYSGSVAATLKGGTLVGVISGDVVTLSQSGIFSSPNVGNGIAVTATDGIGGASAKDYTLTEPTGLRANITQLASVAWTGGTIGNWSTASNWAGGAIPDYSNVAAVTIPKGTTVTYNAGVVGTTKLTTLTDSGDLVMAAGTLSTSGNLTTGGYEQTGGTLDVGGAMTIKSPSGGVVLGEINAGSLSVSSAAGPISQLASTSVSTTGATTLTADNGVSGTGDQKYGITLAQAGDSFGGTVTADGSAITLTDKTALTAVLDSSGATLLTSAGSLNVSGSVGTNLMTTTTGTKHATTFGATTVGKTLVVTSTGAVTEKSSNVLTVAGKGTTTIHNADVTVNGVKGAEIPAP